MSASDPKRTWLPIDLAQGTGRRAAYGFSGLADDHLPQPWRPWPNEDRSDWGRFTPVSAAAVLASTVAQAKASKAAVHCQDHPNGTMRMCQTCKFFISAGGGRSGMMGCPMGGGMMGRGMMRAGACQLVEGRISPMGYCDLYAPGGA